MNKSIPCCVKNNAGTRVCRYSAGHLVGYSTQNFGLWTNRLSQIFIFRCHLKTPSQSGPQVLFKNAIKIYRKKWTCFLDFLPICNTRCCIRSPAWPTYSTPKGTRVLTPGCNISGFPWRSERQSQPCTFRSCGAESRPSAWCLRNPSQASGPQSFQRIGDN